jgi:hypothetical protein
MTAFTAAEIHRGDWLPLTPGLQMVLVMSGVDIMVPAHPDSIKREKITLPPHSSASRGMNFDIANCTIATLVSTPVITT